MMVLTAISLLSTPSMRKFFELSRRPLAEKADVPRWTCVPRPPSSRPGVPGVMPEESVNSGNEAAAVERQLGDGLLSDDGPESGRLVLDERRLGGDVDGLGDLAGLQRE